MFKGFNGGLPQSFILEVIDLQAKKIKLNASYKVYINIWVETEERNFVIPVWDWGHCEIQSFSFLFSLHMSRKMGMSTRERLGRNVV
jgi:hypothetical protein